MSLTSRARPLLINSTRLHPLYLSLSNPRYNSHSTSSSSKPEVDHSASSKLFDDAKVEDSSPETNNVASKFSYLVEQENKKYRNWDGDESTEDAVLRMLVDKYKPLRTGSIRTADEKLKTEIQAQAQDSNSSSSSRIFLSSLPPLQAPATRSKARSSESLTPEDAKARAEIKKAKKLEAGAQRVGKALEKSLDYRLSRAVGDITDTAESSSSAQREEVVQHRLNPVSMKGWASLVEEKIEKARSSGVFNNVEGRGKPIQRHPDESNPFIAREEFLMNRILKRNEAAPPWVETQGDLEQAIRTFRAIISSSWVRRATRTILSDLPPPPYPRTLNNVTVESISKLRDKEWEEKEASYHEAALKEVNDQIRRHNGMAPFSARRPYLMLKYELERCYEKNAEDVLKNLEETLSREPLNRKPGAKRSGDAASASGNLGEFTTFSLWDALRRAALRLFGYGSSPPSPPGRSASNQTPSTSP